MAPSIPSDVLAEAVEPQLDPAETRSLDDLWRAVTRIRWSHNRTASWAAWAWRARVEPSFGKHRLSEVTPERVEAFFSVFQDQPAFYNRLLAMFRIMFKTAKRWHWVTSDPAEGLDRKREAPRTRYLELDELHRLEDARRSLLRSDPRQADALTALRLLMLTGCRPSEVLGLRWQEYNVETRLLNLGHAKTGPRAVILSQVAADLLAEHRARRRNPSPSTPMFRGQRGGQLNLPALRSAWFDVARNAGLPTRAHGFRLYDLRRSFGTLLIQQGTPTALVAQALGHADEHTTRKHYAFLRLDQSRSAVELAGQAMTQHRPESPS